MRMHAGDPHAGNWPGISRGDVLSGIGCADDSFSLMNPITQLIKAASRKLISSEEG